MNYLFNKKKRTKDIALNISIETYSCNYTTSSVKGNKGNDESKVTGTYR